MNSILLYPFGRTAGTERTISKQCFLTGLSRDSLMHCIRYKTTYSLLFYIKYSRTTSHHERSQNLLFFILPKNPSQAKLPGEQFLLDMDPASVASLLHLIQLGASAMAVSI